MCLVFTTSLILSFIVGVIVSLFVGNRRRRRRGHRQNRVLLSVALENRLSLSNLRRSVFSQTGGHAVAERERKKHNGNTWLDNGSSHV